MSYQNDTPGPAIKICYNPNVPLYNYRRNLSYQNANGKWPYLGGPPKNSHSYNYTSRNISDAATYNPCEKKK